MELLYSALSERDIELLDELFDPECAVIADEVERKYSDQREYIEDILNTINFDVLSYEYFSLDASTNRFFNYSLYFFEMRITDADGTRYTLRTTPCVCRKGLFDFKIIRIKYFITPKPAC